MGTISVTIITLNAASHIEDCLHSVQWANEIIIIDSGSTDNTIEICKQYTSKIYITDWPGFGKQKNRALQKATCDWILSIDADEIVPVKLRDEIQEAILQSNIDGFMMPRLSSYCGQFIMHSGWHPDYIIRLFRRGKGEFDNSSVHEKVIIEGKIEKLKNHLIHYSFDNLEEVLTKVNHYSSASAQDLFQRGKRATLLTAILRGTWTFIRTYILQAGFLDGQKGVMLAISNAEGTYYKYLKLALLYEKPQGRNR